MSNSEKILKSLSSLIENGILTSSDIKKKYQLISFKGTKFSINLSLYLDKNLILKDCSKTRYNY